MRILGATASSFEVYSSFESIATAVGTGSSGTITFSSIPDTYKHLQIRGIAKSTATANGQYSLRLRLNGDTGSNYTRHAIIGDGSSVTASTNTGTSLTFIFGGMTSSAAAIADMMGTSIIDIIDYNSSTKNKTIRTISGYDTNGNVGNLQSMVLSSGLWMDTSSITSISLISDGPAFTTSTVFSLYGIKGA
jgi:hypothetical protein